MGSCALMAFSSAPVRTKLLGQWQERVRDVWHRPSLMPLRMRWRRYLWESSVCKRREVDIWIEPGARMRLYADDRLSKLIYSEDFEWQERRFLKTFLRPGDVFVDVGANIGLYAVIAGHRVGDQGRVYALEPSARPFRRLLVNVALNRLANVECVQLALSDRAEQVAISTSLDGHDAWNSLSRPVAGSMFTEEIIDCVRWDNFARERHLVGRVVMMKIDVEGWEQHVLRGGAETFARDDAPILQVEFTDAAARSGGSSCADLYRQLEALGYRLYVYDAYLGTLERDPLREVYPYDNLIAAKRVDQLVERLGHHVA